VRDSSGETLPLTLRTSRVTLTCYRTVGSSPFRWDDTCSWLSGQLRRSQSCWCKKCKWWFCQTHKDQRWCWRRDRLRTNRYQHPTRIKRWTSDNSSNLLHLQQFQQWYRSNQYTIVQQGMEHPQARTCHLWRECSDKWNRICSFCNRAEAHTQKTWHQRALSNNLR